MRTAQICSSDFQGIKEAKRDLIVTAKAIFLIGREPVKSGPNKGQMVESISRRISFHELNQVSGHFLRKCLYWNTGCPKGIFLFAKSLKNTLL